MENKLIGFTNSSRGIGDKLQFGALPENWFKSLGYKLIDLDECWVFNHNPYVLRGVYPKDGVIDLWQIKLSQDPFLSQQDRFNSYFNIKTFLRHPRLYIYENEIQLPRRITVHTNGISRGGVMPDHVIEQIAKKYKDYEVIQVGGKNDRVTPFINKLGLDIWESARLIASSEIFIGVNSSMMNVAGCYPQVRRKLLIYNEDLTTYFPVSPPDHWIDYNWEYFNDGEDDLGITYSYKKI